MQFTLNIDVYTKNTLLNKIAIHFALLFMLLRSYRYRIGTRNTEERKQLSKLFGKIIDLTIIELRSSLLNHCCDLCIELDLKSRKHETRSKDHSGLFKQQFLHESSFLSR